MVNQKELAQILGISTRQVRNLKSEGLFQTQGNGRGYVLEKCVQEYLNFKINAETHKRTSITTEEVRAEHEEVKKQISILRLRKLRRELHEAANVEMFLSNMLMRFKSRLLSLPPRLAMEILGETDLNNAIRIIKGELEQVLEELSEYNPDEIDGVVSLPGEEDEVLEDDEDEEWEAEG